MSRMVTGGLRLMVNLIPHNSICCSRGHRGADGECQPAIPCNLKETQDLRNNGQPKWMKHADEKNTDTFKSSQYMYSSKCLNAENKI